MTAPPDETLDLLNRWHQGDADAFGELVESNLPWIRSLVRRRLGPNLRLKAETADVVQEAMVRALRDGPRFVVSDREHFRALVAAIVENVLRMQNRGHRQLRRDIAREKELASSILDLDGTSPSQAAIRSEEAAWLELSIELLDPADREVIALRQWDGLPFEDVGKQLGITADTARVRFRRALGRLAPMMKKLQDGQIGEVLRDRTKAVEPAPSDGDGRGA